MTNFFFDIIIMLTFGKKKNEGFYGAKISCTRNLEYLC